MDKNFTREEIEDMRTKIGLPDDAPDFCVTNELHRQEMKNNAEDTMGMVLEMEGVLLLSDPVHLALSFNIINNRLRFLENRVSELEDVNKKLRDALS